MSVRLLFWAGATVLLVSRPSQAQDAPPATVPPNFSASAPSIGFSSPSIGFSSPSIGYPAPRIEFVSPPMTDEELALAPKPPAPPPPAVKGLEVTEVEGGVRYTLSADILFDFDKATLRPKATQALDAMSSDVRQRFAQPRFLVDGYTDSKGSDSYNVKLSLRRAAAVKDYLTVNANFAAETVQTEGRGEANPVAANETPDGQDDPDGRQKNRRVEILVKAAE
jgi:outer membrane protein OmpA-like peptidoglycan-associated protein